MKYIKVLNWRKFQHYSKRRPPWVKLLTEIIDEFDVDGEPKKFWSLDDTAKLTFIGLLCLQTRFNDKIPLKSEKWLADKLGFQGVDLQPLVKAGYISILNGMLAGCAQDASNMLAPETETETETETEDRGQKQIKEPTGGPKKKGRHFNKKIRAELELIESLAKKVSALKLKKFNVYQIIQGWANQDMPPEAITKTLQGLIDIGKEGKPYILTARNPEGYVRGIMKTVAANVREAEHMEIDKQEKNEWMELIRKLKSIQ